VAPEGTLTYPEMAAMMGKPLITLPMGVLGPLATLGKYLGISPVSRTTLAFIRHPIVVDGSKFNRSFGFRPRWDTRQAFARFIGAL